MSDKCPKCPDMLSKSNLLDVAGNIFSKDLLIPMTFYMNRQEELNLIMSNHKE